MASAKGGQASSRSNELADLNLSDNWRLADGAQPIAQANCGDSRRT